MTQTVLSRFADTIQRSGVDGVPRVVLGALAEKLRDDIRKRLTGDTK